MRGAGIVLHVDVSWYNALMNVRSRSQMYSLAILQSATNNQNTKLPVPLQTVTRLTKEQNRRKGIGWRK